MISRDAETREAISQAPATRSRPLDVVGLDTAQEASLIAAARSTKIVEGLTHAHYRYPARFSPVLARTAIELFTERDDLVGDPFIGGGTTCVEALAAARRSFGTDISSLATFISQAKTSIIDHAASTRLVEWADSTSRSLSAKAAEPRFESWQASGYFKHLDGERWPLRRAIAQCVDKIQELEPLLHELGRLIILRTAQSALDGRRVRSGLNEFRQALRDSARTVSAGSAELADCAGINPRTPLILNRSCVGIEVDPAITAMGKARLILTSPPYPGVHVLYHRWQVGGGKETAAPFFIANQLDGSGAAYYTMGGRTAGGIRKYFAELKKALTSITALGDERTMFIQVVAFSQPEWQLQTYLNVASGLGLEELGLHSLADVGDGRLWREVPNRKWYNSQRAANHAAQEVVLFHRLRKGSTNSSRQHDTGLMEGISPPRH